MREGYVKQIIAIVATTIIFLFLAQEIVIASYENYEDERLHNEMENYVSAVKIVYKDFKGRIRHYVEEIEVIDDATDMRELKDILEYVDSVYDLEDNPLDKEPMMTDLLNAEILDRLIVYDHTDRVFLSKDYNYSHLILDLDSINKEQVLTTRGNEVNRLFSSKNNLSFMFVKKSVDEYRFRVIELETVNDLVYDLDHRHRVDILEGEVVIYSSNKDAVYKTYQIRDYYTKDLLIDYLENDQPKHFSLMSANGNVDEFLAYKTSLDDSKELIVLYDNSDFDDVVKENVIIIQGMSLFMMVAISAIGVFLYFVFLKNYNPFKM